MEHKIWDNNAYRRAHFRANPDARLRQEEGGARSLLQRLGYTISPPERVIHDEAFDRIVKDRIRKREERERARQSE